MIPLAGDSKADDAVSRRCGNLGARNRFSGNITIEVGIVLTPIRENLYRFQTCVSGTGPVLLKGETKSP